VTDGADPGDAPTVRRSGPSSRRPRSGRILRETVLLVVVALAVAALLRAYVVQAFVIPSESMEQTLQPVDRVLVSKIELRFSDVERGDIVVFADPGGWLPPVDQPGRLAQLLTFLGLRPSATGNDLVKRVIGVAGDRVACCDESGRVTVNGIALEEPYVYPGDVPSDASFDVEVPLDGLWVMGDHRSDSADSRAHLGDPGGGVVPVDRVVGRAFAVVWPVSRWQGLDIPPTFDRLGPP
jgi:signal peptidase I